jgi:hypothetical protein
MQILFPLFLSSLDLQQHNDHVFQLIKMASFFQICSITSCWHTFLKSICIWKTDVVIFIISVAHDTLYLIIIHIWVANSYARPWYLLIDLLWLQNTASLTLDDTKGFERHLKCQWHLYYWMLYNSQFHIRYGNQHLFTTPICGTFYYVLDICTTRCYTTPSFIFAMGINICLQLQYVAHFITFFATKGATLHL